MSKKRWIKLFKKIHKWPAIIIAFFAILFASSGIIMNHRSIFSSVDVSRKLLPPNYTYKNWNQAALRGSLQTDYDEILIYGNIGIWSTDSLFTKFTDFNQGFPTGIDNRKIYSLVKFNNQFIAATHFGLFARKFEGNSWQKIKLPVTEQRISDLSLKEDTLLVLTRYHMLKSVDGVDFEKVQLSAPEGYVKKTGLFDIFWQLHSGELFGISGKLLVDFMGLVTILLSVTGLFHFFSPKVIKKRKRKQKEVTQLIAIKKKNLHWHNIAGYVFFLLLIINTFSGMHLRPPLLIAIADKQIGIIPGTHLDSPNPWFDKLRRVHWDKNSKRYIFSTFDGFYFAEESLNKPLSPALWQPPVSVMGCNVFKELTDDIYLVGSFSGMYLWNIRTGFVSDFFTEQPYIAPEGMQSPIAANMVAGFIEENETVYWFDYNFGAISLKGKEFPEMPEKIMNDSPVSLWNLALEIHTGRIFEHLLGPFYILYVPLAGICILLVLTSGVYLWWKLYRKKTDSEKPCKHQTKKGHHF